MNRRSIALLIIMAIFTAFGLVEISLRILERNQYQNRPEFEYYKKIYSDERDKKYLFGHQSNIRVKIQEQNANFTFATNSDGLREMNDYDSLEKSAIFLGDSVIEGSPVNDEDTIDSIFEKETKLISLNFGLGSASTVQEYYWLLGKYKSHYNTKIIVLGFTLNDFEQNTFRRYFDTSLGNWVLYDYISPNGIEDRISKRTSAKDWIKNELRKSKAVTFIYSSLNPVKKSLPGSEKDLTENQKLFTEFYVDKIKQFSEEIGANFLVVIFPTESQLKVDYGKDRRSQDYLIDLFKKRKIKYIDLYGFIKEEKTKNYQGRLFHDDIHPNKEGYRIIGNYLSEFVPEMFPEIFKDN